MKLRNLITKLSPKQPELMEDLKQKSKFSTMEEKKRFRDDLAQRLVRFNESDEVYLGLVAERFLISEAGVLIQAICNGLADEILSNLDSVDSSKASIKLGQASAYRNIIKNIEQLAIRKQVLQRPVDPIEEIESEISEVPNPRMYRGMRGIV